MKRLILALAFLATASVAMAATTTPNLSLQKPADGEYGWGTMLRLNWDKIDTAAGTEHNAGGAHTTITGTSATVSGATTTGTLNSTGDASFSSGVTIGGQYRTTWPSSGSASVTIDDVLINGDTTTRNINVGRATASGYDINALSASLPSLSFVDVAHFDNSKNPAWLDKTEGKSWYTETVYTGKQYVQTGYANDAAALAANPNIQTNDIYYNTASSAFKLYSTGTTIYRAGTQKFPMRGFVTAETGRVIVWDSAGATPTMWMVFTAGATNMLYNAAIGTVAMRGNYLLAGDTANGLNVIDFVGGSRVNYHVGAQFTYRGDIAQRNASASHTQTASIGLINAAVNDVAITYLDDAPLDEYGMRVPTIAAATAGGVSVINSEGVVWDITSTAAGGYYSASAYVGFTPDGRIAYVLDNAASRAMVRIDPLPTADYVENGGYNIGASLEAYVSASVASNVVVRTIGSSGANFGIPVMADNVLVFPSSLGLSMVKRNPDTTAKGMAANVTSVYNTGHMIGDIRRAYLANSKTADRSVKGGTLVENGSVTETVNAGGRNVYSGFSAANYFSEATHADWNALGTGDFSILMSGVKWGTAAQIRCLFSMGDGASNGSMMLRMEAANTIKIHIYAAGSFSVAAVSTAAFTDTAEHVVEVQRSGTLISILVDGVSVANVTSATTISNATGSLFIGERQDASNPWVGGQVASFRISATAPTVEQSAFIAAQENALNGGALGLLSIANNVKALSYDDSTGVLSVGNGSNVDQFKGLLRLSSAAHGVTTLTGLASGSGEKAIIGTGGSMDGPPRSINSELRATQLELAELKNSKQNYSFTSSGTTWALPQGFKASGTIFNITDGTFAAMAQEFDGFIWTLTGLTTAKVHNIMIKRVAQ